MSLRWQSGAKFVPNQASHGPPSNKPIPPTPTSHPRRFFLGPGGGPDPPTHPWEPKISKKKLTPTRQPVVGPRLGAVVKKADGGRGDVIGVALGDGPDPERQRPGQPRHPRVRESDDCEGKARPGADPPAGGSRDADPRSLARSPKPRHNCWHWRGEGGWGASPRRHLGRGQEPWATRL